MSSKRDWPHVGVVSAFVLLLAVQNASNVQAGWCHSRFDSRSGNIARAASRPLLAFASPPQASPTHFVVLVHGYAGSPRDLTYLQRSIERIGSGRFRVHAAQCNSGRTRDGIRNGGSRLAKEVKSIIAENPSLTHISIVGNSLGGLYARYAISLLYDPVSRQIGGLEPEVFLTIASPHLGIRHYLPVHVPQRLHPLAGVFVGKSGEDLFLLDREGLDDDSTGISPPLLLRMACDDRFIDPLRAFKYRRAYANVKGDLLVTLPTAAFQVEGEQVVAIRSLRYRPEAVMLDIIRTAPLSLQNVNSPPGVSSTRLPAATAVAFMRSPSPASMREETTMARRLNMLDWSKVLVEFRDTLPRAHNMICALSRDLVASFLYKRGRPVMEHAAWFVVDPDGEGLRAV